MNELLHNLIEALREELKEYGEMLALLDQQQQMVTHRQTQDLLQCVGSINLQAETIAIARREREQRQREVARELQLPADATFTDVMPKVPSPFQSLIKALVQENNQLLARIQQRARQNHLMLTRIVELMQRFIGSLFPGNPATYDNAGQLLGTALPQHSVYNAIG
jgi:flagellar biosynthesis/type III secretory pathway chaperone